MNPVINKWNILIAVLVLWIALGLLLFPAHNSRQPHSFDPETGPQRIICTAPNLTEIAFALDMGDRIVGVPNDSTYPPDVNEIPKIGSFWSPSIESIIALRPDLVMTLGFEQQTDLADNLNRMDYQTLSVNIEQIDELYDAIKEIGTLNKHQPTRAETLLHDLTTQIDAYSTHMATDNKPKILWVIQRDPLRVAGTSTFINDLIEYAGGVNAIGDTLHQYPPIGSEQVYASKPDVIIEPAMGGGDLEAQLESAKEYWNKYKIPATTNNRIYVIKPDTVCQLGPRLFEGIKLIGKHINPKLHNEFINEHSTDSE